MSKIKLDLPILLIAFNRPSLTKKVFEKIKQVKPEKLYIAIDGARKNNINDIKKINEINKLFKNISWKCKVFFLKRKNNLGCKLGVSQAINWFFKNETKGIILEDDCLPSKDFFYFCKEMLVKYKNNKNIFMITGDNFQDGKIRGDGSYYFSKLTHVWGWATWRRAWKHYDVKMKFWPKFKNSNKLKNIFRTRNTYYHFKSIFNSVYNNNIDTWDYQWTASMWYNNGFSISPNYNLVKNIGFGPDATHTKISDKRSKNQKLKKIFPLKHPSSIIINQDADEYTYLNLQGGQKKIILRNILRKIKFLFNIL